MASMELLLPGALVPNLAVQDTSGAELPLAWAWSQGPALLFFLRHFGCSSCREHLFRVRDAYPRLIERGAAVIAIAHNDPELARRFAQQHALPFPILTDPTRHVYQAFGLAEGSLWDTLGLPVLVRQAGDALRGNVPSLAPRGSSLTQLSGTFIVDRAGVVRFAHLAQPVYNYPQIETYLAVFEQLGGL